ncbi:hypothetical protein P153DRAFT_122581 [Dothidotthia symphoricarpi CBS 119687]|uniref:Uncharacterized protein n=1 Tax=Dothidotthia symphoricarpi CBS 119687 TaxID=1392245 RepID=A0A6A6A115_9PLEO|nr:uncharacterized protein P153DRAFT_122581 [Dothidotthia symphoricarpi CBS 119687]KAF2125206.1 hypothetical protein P153DRAFT_122581 [Dothidotthia symphoricarpi CBS 119687]
MRDSRVYRIWIGRGVDARVVLTFTTVGMLCGEKVHNCTANMSAPQTTTTTTTITTNDAADTDAESIAMSISDGESDAGEHKRYQCCVCELHNKIFVAFDKEGGEACPLCGHAGCDEWCGVYVRATNEILGSE